MEKKIKIYWNDAEDLINKQFKKVPLPLKKVFMNLLKKAFISGFYAGEDNAKQKKP